MTAFLKLVEEKYNGVEAYVKKYVNLNDDDIASIRQNILIPSACLSAM